MTPRLGTFLRDIGKLLHLPAGLALLSLPVIIYFREWFSLLPFGLMALSSLVIGQVLYQLFKKHNEASSGFTIALVAASWLLLPIFGIIAFHGIALNAPAETYPAVKVFDSTVNSFFEAMSGFTGTGLSMVDDPSKLPYTLQWWRTFMEWVGGIGVIMLASMLLSFNHDEKRLYQAETRNWTIDGASVLETIHKIWWIYVGYSILSILAFFLAGMPFWEALNHGMTAIGTGGFSVTSNSFRGYDSLIKGIGVVIMITGAISFRIHFLLIFKRKLKKIFFQTQLKYFLVILTAAFLIMLLINPEASFIDNLFQIASAFGTCGLNSADIGMWTATPLFLIIILMLMGGNAGSTAGGIKTERIAWFTKAVVRDIKNVWSSEKDEPSISFNGQLKKPHVSKRNVQQAASMFFLWMITLAAGTLALSYLLGAEYNFYEVLFDAASALNNVGLSSGLTNSEIPSSAKMVLTLLMWVGRLEIMAVLILLVTLLPSVRKKG